ncbi:MAG: hypothetical protein WAU68_06970 [Vitreimonas sp.]
MTKPDYEGPLYTASFPAHIDNDGKNYFIFQLLDANGVAVDPVFYRDIALAGSYAIVKTVFDSCLERRKLQVRLDPRAGASHVKTVKLGAPY